MKKVSIPNLIMFLLSLVALVISMGIFYNQGILVDESGIGAAALYGGGVWLLLNWLRLLLLAAVCAVSLPGIFKRKGNP